jgi:hypothetical protein
LGIVIKAALIMKNKIVSFTIVLSFLACIICTPVHIFLQNFYKSGAAFKTVDLKGVAKNIVFSAEKMAGFDDFTQNIKSPKKKIFDFSSSLALMSAKQEQKFIPANSGANADFLKQFDFSNVFYFADIDRHRLRTSSGADIGTLFILFILIYIGMIRAVYSKNKNILIPNNKKPLFA